MNNQKICFIICTADLAQAEEAVIYIKNLHVPTGYEIEAVIEENSINRAAVYNEVLRRSDAKYKVYLRDDVRIIQKEFLEKAITLFAQNPKLGMLGISGNRCAFVKRNSPVYESGEHFGEFYSDSVDRRVHYKYSVTEKEYEKVLVLNNMLLITQYDLPWREDLFPEGDFCEYAQALEFWKAGYEVAVPKMEEPWCFADNVDEYKAENNAWRRAFEAEYSGYYEKWEGYFTDYYNEPKELEGNEPLVSVLTSVYNGEKFVEETIRSVMTQTYQNLQIIVVDDCSTDGSRTVIDKLAQEDERIVRVYMPKNSHVCKASNEGYKQVKGKYVAIIGHDDVWYPDKIKKQVQFMEANPEYAAVFAMPDIMDDHGKLCNDVRPDLYELFDQYNRTSLEWVETLYFYTNVLCAPSALIRVECLKGKPIYQFGLVQLQDFALWMDLAAEYPIYVIRERLMKYRVFLETKSNLSYGTAYTANRQSHEYSYIMKSFLYKLSDEKFRYHFKKHFRNADSETKDELMCERAFILLAKKNYYCISAFVELFEEEATRELLENKFHFYLTDFYEANRGFLA